jgi:AbiV family abortive infection protein
MKSRFLDPARACRANGQRLLDEAEWLSTEQARTCFALATIAQEEFAKAFLLILVAREIIPWNSFIHLRVPSVVNGLYSRQE